MSHQTQRIYEFGPFRLDADDRLLWRDGKTIPLQPKVFDLLLALVERPGRLVKKEELMELVWPDTFVEEANIASNISILRKTLGEIGQQFIETAPKRGYRFVVPVKQLAAERVEPDLTVRFHSRIDVEEGIDTKPAAPSSQPASAHPRRWGAFKTKSWPMAVVVLAVVGGGIWVAAVVRHPGALAHRTTRSIAVLPFKPLLADSRHEALEIGMADSLIIKLSNLKQLMVKPLSAVRKYTALDQDPLAAGREQGVDAVLDGSLHLSEGKMRATWRLVDTRDGSVINADHCDEYCATVFETQDMISKRIVESLELAMTGEESRSVAKHDTNNLEAYTAYETGRIHANKKTPEGTRLAIQYYQQAIDLDPKYARAYAGLSWSYCGLGRVGAAPMVETYTKAQVLAEKAIALDETVAEAHQAMAMIILLTQWDWARAKRELARAVLLDPNSVEARHSYSHVLEDEGSGKQSLYESLQILKIDPTDPVMNAHLGWHYLITGQPDHAIDQLQKSLAMGENYWAHFYLGRAYELTKQYDEAIAQFQKALVISSGSLEAKIGLGHAYAISGHRADAQKIIDELTAASKERFVPLSYLTYIYVGLGDREQAFTWINLAINDHYGWLIELKTDPRFEVLRADPRFPKILHRLNLSQ